MTTSGGRILCIVGILAVLTACRQERVENQAGVETLQLTSSFLERAEYDAAAQTLTLYFDDASVYRYAEVPRDVFAGLHAPGVYPGHYFNESIRGSYDFRRLSPPRRRASPPRTQPILEPRPEIPCAGSEAMRREEVVSVALDAVSYDPATDCLVLYFDSGHVYRYGGVPVEVYGRLLEQGPDPVTYFNASIWGKYPKQRLR